MKWLIVLSLLCVVSISPHYLMNEDVDYSFSPIVVPVVVTEKKPSLNITNSTIAPVGRLTITTCESEDPLDDSIGFSSVVLVGDVSRSMGNKEYPFVYLFTTAKHAIPTIVNIPTGPLMFKVASSRWVIEMWSYNKFGDIGPKSQKIDLCKDNPESNYTVYRSDNHDMALIMVFTKTAIVNVRVAMVRPKRSLDDYRITMPVNIVGCQHGVMPFLRSGIISIMGYDKMWSSAPVNGGDSGGGVFDKQGHLIGIIAWKPGHNGLGTGCGFIPIARLHDELLKNKMIPILREIWR